MIAHVLHCARIYCTRTMYAICQYRTQVNSSPTVLFQAKISVLIITQVLKIVRKAKSRAAAVNLKIRFQM